MSTLSTAGIWINRSNLVLSEGLSFWIPLLSGHGPWCPSTDSEEVIQGQLGVSSHLRSLNEEFVASQLGLQHFYLLVCWCNWQMLKGSLCLEKIHVFSIQCLAGDIYLGGVITLYILHQFYHYSIKVFIVLRSSKVVFFSGWDSTCTINFTSSGMSGLPLTVESVKAVDHKIVKLMWAASTCVHV